MNIYIGLDESLAQPSQIYIDFQQASALLLNLVVVSGYRRLRQADPRRRCLAARIPPRCGCAGARHIRRGGCRRVNCGVTYSASIFCNFAVFCALRADKGEAACAVCRSIIPSLDAGQEGKSRGEGPGRQLYLPTFFLPHSSLLLPPFPFPFPPIPFRPLPRHFKFPIAPPLE